MKKQQGKAWQGNKVERKHKKPVNNKKKAAKQAQYFFCVFFTSNSSFCINSPFLFIGGKKIILNDDWRANEASKREKKKVQHTNSKKCIKEHSAQTCSMNIQNNKGINSSFKFLSLLSKKKTKNDLNVTCIVIEAQI